MTRRFGCFSVLSAFAAVMSVSSVQAEEHYVLLMGQGYFPDQVHVVAGDTIRFINMTTFPMSANAVDASWDTGVLQQNQEFVLPINEGMTQAYGNSVTDVVDQYGQAVGIMAAGMIDYVTPANVTVNSVVSQ